MLKNVDNAMKVSITYSNEAFIRYQIIPPPTNLGKFETWECGLLVSFPPIATPLRIGS